MSGLRSPSEGADTTKVTAPPRAGSLLPRPFEADLEREFRVVRNASRSRWFVPTALLGLVFFDLYVLIDLALAPQVLALSLGLRLGLVTPVALVGLWLRGRRIAARPGSRVDVPLVAGAASLVVGVLAVVQRSAPGALGGAYFAGALIVVVFFSTLLRNDVRGAVAVLATLVAAFGSGQWFVGSDPVAIQATALLAVAVSGLFGLVLAGTLEESERARFLAERRERRLAAEREELIAALAQAAVRDELTGLLNRRGLLDRVATQPATAGGAGVLLVDVDHFKELNDRFGHLEGDRCLTLVADALASACRPTDVVARFGGEEFVVVLDGEHGQDAGEVDVQLAGERLRAAVRACALPHPRGGVVTVSVGAARGEWEAALAAADEAVYAAKAAGRDTVVVAAAVTGPTAGALT
ncbi:diguanylate cyclase [Kineococcus sp. DHX-1]|uniref:GGDEF domain-containing protein n=1 Tax=Kineococcus sp. DHX-1 TaxID=3349638 RepID=UPI0036D32A94